MLDLKGLLYAVKDGLPALTARAVLIIFALTSAGTTLGSPALALVEVSNAKPKQGEVVEVTYRPTTLTEGSEPPFLRFVKSSVRLFPVNTTTGDYRALIAIPADLDPGPYKVEIGSEEKVLSVLDGGFPVQHLTLPKSKDNFDTSPGEEEAVNKAKATVSETRFWSDKFVVPSKARRSAAFGLKRVVNGRLLKDYFHSGLDFAANLGSPVVACAPGRVVLAKTGFKLHGNVIAIDHGQGVVSFYIHLKKLLVKENEMVEAGQEIGLVGMTGRANGPHLHFSIYVNQTASSPSQWFLKAI
jgi:lysostaphin